MKILNISLFAVFVIKTVFELAVFSLYAEVRDDLGKKKMPPFPMAFHFINSITKLQISFSEPGFPLVEK